MKCEYGTFAARRSSFSFEGADCERVVTLALEAVAPDSITPTIVEIDADTDTCVLGSLRGNKGRGRWGTGKGETKGRDDPEALPPPEACGG